MPRSTLASKSNASALASLSRSSRHRAAAWVTTLRACFRSCSSATTVESASALRTLVCSTSSALARACSPALTRLASFTSALVATVRCSTSISAGSWLSASARSARDSWPSAARLAAVHPQLGADSDERQRSAKRGAWRPRSSRSSSTIVRQPRNASILVTANTTLLMRVRGLLEEVELRASERRARFGDEQQHVGRVRARPASTGRGSCRVRPPRACRRAPGPRPAAGVDATR